MKHTVKSMIKLYDETLRLFETLPEEFTAREFNALRDSMDRGAICIKSARELGFIRIVREEPVEYYTEEDLYTSVDGKQFTIEELFKIPWDKRVDLFGTPEWWTLPSKRVTISHTTKKNIFVVDVEKFKSFAKNS
jgi:hypothetical protein